MAAYAAVVSLMNTLNNINNHPRLSITFDKEQMGFLEEKVGFLLDFMESDECHEGMSKEEVEDLERRIGFVAHAAEDIIERHVAEQMLCGSTKKGLSLLFDLQKISQDMDSISEKVMKVNAEKGCKNVLPTLSAVSVSPKFRTTGKSSMVGFDDEMMELVHRLTGQRPNRQIVPIVGMGGIGKTTLARNVCENSVIVQFFDVRAWVTVSQQRDVKEILVELVLSIKDTESRDQMIKENESELGEKLYKILCGRRYLLMLDDVWSTEIWDNMKCFFPNNDEKHGIVVTTRLSTVANRFGSPSVVMNFLDERMSWNLFCEKAFGEEGCPVQLEDIGRVIARRCGGLPLAIVVMGGLFRNSHRTQQYWENVAEKVSPVLDLAQDEQCLNILWLSYTHLPVYLKPLFLYMGSHEKYYEFRVSQLIKLWVAEGSLEPSKSRSAEEVAEDYLKDLIDRHLVLVQGINPNGKMKTLAIHDLLRDLCTRIALKENFLCCRKDSFLKVWDGRGYSDSVLDYANLRFLRCTSWGVSLLPCSVSLLWRVQTLIIKGGLKGLVVPSEIWEMPQLRHLEFDDVYFLDPTSDQADIILMNLRTLLTVVNLRLSEEVCNRIPNVKKLYLKYSNFPARSRFYCLHNVGCLHKLESLSCFFKKRPIRGDLLQNLRLPCLLQKLCLTNSGLHWEDLTMIGSLPHLEVLKLQSNAVVGTEWNPFEGEFLRLKFLSIYSCSGLVYWNADGSHFPVLENLVLSYWMELDEIPSGIGEIPTLRVITLNWCSKSAAVSAMNILEEQESLGNEGLHIRVESWDEDDAENSREIRNGNLNSNVIYFIMYLHIMCKRGCLVQIFNENGCPNGDYIVNILR